MQIQQGGQQTVFRWVEYGYVSCLLFVLTQGPVLSMWFESEKQTSKVALAPQLATYIAFQIPAMMLAARQKYSRADVQGPLGLFVALCLWFLASSIWATNGQHTAVEAVSLTATFIGGVYVAKRFSLREKLVLIVVAMQPGLILSRFAIAQDWDNARSIEGFWVGIYFNRNSLAPVAMVSVIAAATLFVMMLRRKDEPLRIIKLFVLVDVVIFGLVMAVRTESNTPFGGLIAFSAVVGFWQLFRLQILQRYAVAAFVAAVAMASWLAIAFQSKILSLFGETVSFNGRSEIWKYSWNGFLERPFAGWGWLSAWRSWAFMRMDLWWTVEGVTWSHNAYLDLLLGGGAVAVALFVGAVIWATFRVAPIGSTSIFDAWPIAFMYFFLAMATQESFIIGNHFLWLIFISVAVASTKKQDQSLTDVHQ
jgi:exopolysaccharide production protein ExoQ